MTVHTIVWLFQTHFQDHCRYTWMAKPVNLATLVVVPALQYITRIPTVCGV